MTDELNEYIHESDREFDDSFTLLHTDHVVVEEIDIEASLKSATQNLGPAVEVVHKVSVHPKRVTAYSLPIQNVEETVQPEASHIMGGNVLDHSDLVEHDNLGDEGDGFQPETVAPHEFPRVPPTVDDQCHH